jgi:PAS domain S-box-containing protein
MDQPKTFLAVVPEDLSLTSKLPTIHCTRVQPDYIAVVNHRRKFVEVSPSFCKLLGYTEEELLGRTYDEFTVPRTHHIPIMWGLLQKNRYMQGIWVFAHRTGTKLFVRYEVFDRDEEHFEAHMELLGAGA